MALALQLSGAGTGQVQAWGCYNLLAVAISGLIAALGVITQQWGLWTNLQNALHKSQLLAICPILVEGRVVSLSSCFLPWKSRLTKSLNAQLGVFGGGEWVMKACADLVIT